MLKLTWIEFFFRTIPEMFILIWGIHVISRKSFNILQYVLSSIVVAILSFFIRWLPIYLGVHTILNIILIISTMVIIGIPIIKAIYSTLLMIFILSLSEFFNVILLSLLKIDTSIQFSNPIMKCAFSIPSLAIVLTFIITINYLLKTKEGIKSVSN